MSDGSDEGRQAPSPGPPCPSCEKPVERDCETFPFCSRRCRLVDLGKWLDEKYRVPSRPQDD